MLRGLFVLQVVIRATALLDCCKAANDANALIYCIFLVFLRESIESKAFYWVNTFNHNFIPRKHCCAPFLWRAVLIECFEWIGYLRNYFSNGGHKKGQSYYDVITYSYVSAYLQPCWSKAITEKARKPCTKSRDCKGTARTVYNEHLDLDPGHSSFTQPPLPPPIRLQQSTFFCFWIDESAPNFQLSGKA